MVNLALRPDERPMCKVGDWIELPCPASGRQVPKNALRFQFQGMEKLTVFGGRYILFHCTLPNRLEFTLFPDGWSGRWDYQIV